MDCMATSNAARTDAKLREIFDVKGRYTDEPQGDDPRNWSSHIVTIRDLSHQVVEIELDTANTTLGRDAGRAALSLVGGDLPQLLGIQVTGPSGEVLAKVKRSEIMMLNVPLGKGRPDGW